MIMRFLKKIATPGAVGLLLFGGAAAPAAGQSTDTGEEAAVRVALQHYLDGHATGLGSEHEKVFAPEARLFWIGGGELQTRTSAEYIAGAPGEPAEDEAERRRRITMVDVTGDAAVARIELDYPRARIVDYMSLLNIDGEWRIMNKIFHLDPQPEGGRR